jgi:hypothetical protein
MGAPLDPNPGKGEDPCGPCGSPAVDQAMDPEGKTDPESAPPGSGTCPATRIRTPTSRRAPCGARKSPWISPPRKG